MRECVCVCVCACEPGMVRGNSSVAVFTLRPLLSFTSQLMAARGGPTSTSHLTQIMTHKGAGCESCSLLHQCPSFILDLLIETGFFFFFAFLFIFYYYFFNL